MLITVIPALRACCRWSFLAAVPAVFFLSQHAAGPANENAATPPQLAGITRPAMPLFFEAHGSAFIARGRNYNLQLSEGEAELWLGSSQTSRVPVSVRISPRNKNQPEAVPEDPLPGKSHYYLGDDPAAWKTDIAHFGQVRYRDIYDGIDLVYYGREGRVEFDYVVSPGTNPGMIELAFDGTRGLRVGETGDLLLDTPGGVICQHKPVAYQEGPDGRTLVSANYKLLEGDVAGFQLGPYDSTRPLVIDPILDYSTYFGGNGSDEISSIVMDAAGNFYLAGTSGSNTFPAGSPLAGGNPNGPDAFVVKLGPDRKQVLYRVYVGGSGNDVAFVYLSVKPDGSAVIAGYTEATNFPRMNARQNTYGGGDSDAFVTQFNPQGQMVFSTYLGGSGFEGPSDVALDAAGNIYVGGWTSSSNFPRMNAFQNQYGGGPEDGFITKYSPNGAAMVYSTLFGGSGDDFFNSMTVDSTGAMYGAGYTNSTNLTVTPGAFRGTNSGGVDAFAIKLNPAGSALVFSTYIGGSADDWAVDMAVDDQGSMYVGGNTFSTNFPVLSIQNTHAGQEDMFLAKLNPQGSQLVHSTYMGGSGGDLVERVEVNSFREAYVAGWSGSADFPVLNAVQAQRGGSDDAILFKVNAQGNALVYSTYLGGGGRDIPLAVGLDSVGGVVAVGGYTDSSNFPAASPAQATRGSGDDGFLAVYVEAAAVQGANFARGTLAANAIASVFVSHFSAQTQAATTTPLPTSLLGVSVSVTDSQGTSRDCELFVVSPGQINVVVPAATAAGAAAVTVKTADGRQLRGKIEIAAVAPGLFSANATGQGLAAANVGRLRNGVFTFEPLAQFQGGQFVPVPIDMGPATDQVFLIMYGTGLRGANGAAVSVGGTAVGVTGPVAQGQFVGVDQMNLGPLPRTLIGRGSVNITGTAGGKAFNTVTATFQ